MIIDSIQPVVADTPPSPLGGWSETAETLTGALVVPPVASGFQQKTGVLRADGSYCATGALWRRHRPVTLAPDPVAPAADGQIGEALAGRWIWGGLLWGHFGHFLAESTARLWILDALEQAGGPVDGVVFVPKRPRNGERIRGYQQDFFRLMGLDIPIRVVNAPTRVETLVVPGQGFGLGEISAGTAPVRAQFATRFAPDIAPDGPEKLYVSRSRLGYAKGSILGETVVEARLAEAGYEIFHPQAHPMEVQVARYRAARQVVATDGSALHLLAMAQPKDQTLAIIARRKSTAVDLLVRHVASFTQADPLVVDALRRSWFPEGRKPNPRLALGELELAELGRQLQAAGFIADAGAWTNMTPEEVQAALETTGQRWQLKPWQKRQEAKRRRQELIDYDLVKPLEVKITTTTKW